MIHGLAPAYLSNEITMAVDVSNRYTRNFNVNNLYVPIVNTECTRSSFSYQGPIVCNSLPDDLKKCTNLSTFKLKANMFYSSKMF